MLAELIKARGDWDYIGYRLGRSVGSVSQQYYKYLMNKPAGKGAVYRPLR